MKLKDTWLIPEEEKNGAVMELVMTCILTVSTALSCGLV